MDLFQLNIFFSFKRNSIFSIYFRKKFSVKKFTKINPMETQFFSCMQMEVRTDIREYAKDNFS